MENAAATALYSEWINNYVLVSNGITFHFAAPVSTVLAFLAFGQGRLP